MIGSIHFARPLDEGVNETAGNVREHRPDNFLEQSTRKFVMQKKLHLAGVFVEFAELPEPFQPAEWSINQFKPHLSPRPLVVAGGEVRFHGFKVNEQGGNCLFRVAKLELGSVAPRQKRRIVLNPVDQVEHLLC